jgi:CheY-like chemotaxis protein
LGYFEEMLIEAGKVATESLEFNLRRTLEEFTEMWRIQAAATGLGFRADVSTDLPKTVCGDPNRLRQILNNLTSNAIVFTERGQIALAVTAVGSEEPATAIRFAVSDSGIGLRPDQTAKLFSPFVQADTSTTRKFGGTGLGLAISKHLAGLMGGCIGVDSQEGEGSTFWFTVIFQTVPAARLVEDQPTDQLSSEREKHVKIPGQVPGQPAASRPAAHLGAGAATRAANKPRVLIAEDNPANRLVAMAQLARLGYQATAVMNGAEAVDALRHSAYEIILMDCSMPVMDRYEAARRIRERGGSRVPIVALTAYATAADRKRCVDAGMDDFLSKPVDIQQLAEMLARWTLPPASRPDVASSKLTADAP